MSVVGIEIIKVSFLITEPFSFHGAIIGRIIEIFQVTEHYPARSLNAICRKVMVRSIDIALSSGNASVLRRQVVSAGGIRKPSSDQISCAVQIVFGVIVGNPALLHFPIAVKAYISVTFDKAFRYNQTAVILILVVDVHSSTDPIDASMAGILPEAHIVVVFASIIILRHPFIPSRNAQLLDKHILVRINHGIITCSIDGCTECIDDIDQLLVR